MNINDYIDKKTIYIEDHWLHECNIKGCESRSASLSCEGNYYCLKHFIEIVQEDYKENWDELFKP